MGEGEVWQAGGAALDGMDWHKGRDAGADSKRISNGGSSTEETVSGKKQTEKTCAKQKWRGQVGRDFLLHLNCQPAGWRQGFSARIY